ncbi:polysaccharide biosynthesis C-terminal domain-containing protein [Arthrobacter sp. K5]|uniref:Polysaccharide biosynthesis C-terminal domain-containing protein n=1 Tax=Arthrobacter sp. K5 TaxID=2839623 RepID=A0AAU8EWP4_9MICC
MKRQFLAMMFARGFSSALQAANLILLARSTGLADFGLLSIITSMAILVSTLFDFGMNTLIVKASALGRVQQVVAGLRFNALSARVLAISSTAIFVVGALLGFLPAWASILVLGLSIEKKIETSLSVYVADGNRVVPNASILLRRVVPLVATAAAVVLGVDPLVPFSVAYVLVCAMNSLHLDWRLAQRFGVRKRKQDRFREVAGSAWPYFVGNLSAHSRFLDTSLVAVFVSVGGAALYSAATKVVNPLQLIPQALTTVLMPHSARLEAPSAARLIDRLCLLFLSLLIVLLPISLFSVQIIVFIFGPSFEPSAPVLAIALCGLPFVTLSSPLGSVLQSQGFERYVALNGVIFSVVLLLMLVICCSFWGIIGAAAGMAVTFCLKCVSLYAYSRRLRT